MSRMPKSPVQAELCPILVSHGSVIRAVKLSQSRDRCNRFLRTGYECQAVSNLFTRNQSLKVFLDCFNSVADPFFSGLHLISCPAELGVSLDHIGGHLILHPEQLDQG